MVENEGVERGGGENKNYLMQYKKSKINFIENTKIACFKNLVKNICIVYH